jgi:carboxylesterase type B
VRVPVNFHNVDGQTLLQDVIASLTWVQRNIARFGGDPDNVTVYGHSGGAYATFGLLGAASANGSYRRLAGFSPGPSRLQPAWWAEELAHRFVTELGVADTPEKLLDLDTAPWWPPCTRSPRRTSESGAPVRGVRPAAAMPSAEARRCRRGAG